MKFESIASGKGIRVHAPAKINIFLEILGRRPDGFHEIDSLFQAVSLHDTLSFLPREDGEFELEVRSAFDEAGVSVPPAADNLVIRAARMIAECRASSQPAGLSIRLDKGIPMGAGLGGGSSDAAATLMGLDRLWNLSLPLAELEGLAAELGSDVAFFLHGGLARCRGRGEKVCPIPAPVDGFKALSFVLVSPFLEVSTPLIYKKLGELSSRGNDLTIPEPLSNMSFDAVLGSIQDGTLFRNRLEEVAYEAFPALRRLKMALERMPFVRVQLTGSGSTIVCLCSSSQDAQRLEGKIRRGLAQEYQAGRRDFEGLLVRAVTSLPGWSRDSGDDDARP